VSRKYVATISGSLSAGSSGGKNDSDPSKKPLPNILRKIAATREDDIPSLCYGGYAGSHQPRFPVNRFLTVLVLCVTSMSEPKLEDLICLNQEIAAFVKAGIPLELGLKGLSGSLGNRLGKLSNRLADRLSNGMNLSDALAEEGPVVSPVYTAVVEAG